MSKLPIIDLSLFNNGDKATKEIVVKQIYQACHEIGFIYIKNYGSENKKTKEKKVFDYSKYLFDLPNKVKQNMAWSDEFSNQGYVGIERERLNPNNPGDLKEAFNFVGLDNLPTSLHLDAAIPIFYEACRELVNTILQAFSLALELEADFFTIRHSQKNHTLRLLHYPPLQQTPKPGQIRAGEHSDYGSLTLLFQDNIGGLEVKTAPGKWIKAPKLNDIFCSTKHRVIIPDENKAKLSRYSVAFFYNPNLDAEITCLETCQKDKPAIYPPITVGEYFLSSLQSD